MELWRVGEDGFTGIIFIDVIIEDGRYPSGGILGNWFAQIGVKGELVAKV